MLSKIGCNSVGGFVVSVSLTKLSNDSSGRPPFPPVQIRPLMYSMIEKRRASWFIDPMAAEAAMDRSRVPEFVGNMKIEEHRSSHFYQYCMSVCTVSPIHTVQYTWHSYFCFGRFLGIRAGCSPL